jgi:ankyrin repeat protein
MANCQDVSGATPLHYAINAGSDDDERSDVVVKHLLKYGADSTFADTNGRLALHWAANAGRTVVSIPAVYPVC